MYNLSPQIYLCMEKHSGTAFSSRIPEKKARRRFKFIVNFSNIKGVFRKTVKQNTLKIELDFGFSNVLVTFFIYVCISLK